MKLHMVVALPSLHLLLCNLLKTLQHNIDEFADLNKLCLLDSETSTDVSRNFVARLYDQKGKMKSAHDNLNRLRVKIAKQKM
jgi:hypothetical protein